MRNKNRLIILLATITIILATVGYWCTAQQRTEKMFQEKRPLPSTEEIAKLPPDGGPEFNRLIHEKSPYLRQHARNPVNWFPWGTEALEAARKQDKPIFLSVGYSTCHWCHVMEHESFSRKDVADILNKYYIAIKVDREERPDLDKIYMLATQLATGSGGWPNSLWLTPDGKPWFAGTYFPREDSHGRRGFKSILLNLAETWKTRRPAVEAQAEKFATALKQHSDTGPIKASGLLSYKLLETATAGLSRSFDAQRGGFGGAPKFPPHGSLRLLLQEYRRTGDKALLKMATETLDAMARGGIHDHVGGGFHRYSTDTQWLLPHFEKMLYDNAQLARAYVEAFVITGDEKYKKVAEGIFDWLQREMTSPEGSFYSALDADSEGEEGKFYVWTKKEIINALGQEDGEFFCEIYGVTDKGNFHDEATGKKSEANVLHRTKPVPTKLRDRLSTARGKLLAIRGKRIRPLRDEKILAAWNALMINSLAYAGKGLNEPKYTAAAERAADFILQKMRKAGRLQRAYREGGKMLNAYLEDYAFLTNAFLELYQATGEKRWLIEAQSLADEMLKHYRDPAGGGFYLTSDDHEKLLARTRSPMDGAMPSGNAQATEALIRLWKRTGRTKYHDAAKDTLETFQGFMEQMPGGTAGLLLGAGLYLKEAKTLPAEKTNTQPDAVVRRKPVSISAYASALSIRSGETLKLALRVDTDKGWHINSNTPLQEYLIPTALSLKKTALATVSKVTYPSGKKVKFAFSPAALSVYEGQVWIYATLKINSQAKPGEHTLHFILKTQACDDKSCQLPEDNELSIKFTITSASTPSPRRHGPIFNNEAHPLPL